MGIFSGSNGITSALPISEANVSGLVADLAARPLAVSCVLACDSGAQPDLHDAGDHPVLWDALYDNLQDFNTLSSIPTGLGLSFLFDGTSSVITSTVAGVWALGYQWTLSTDATWIGSFSTGLQTLSVGRPSTASSVLSPLETQVARIPNGTALTQQFITTTQATATPYTLANMYVSIVRVG